MELFGTLLDPFTPLLMGFAKDDEEDDEPDGSGKSQDSSDDGNPDDEDDDEEDDEEDEDDEDEEDLDDEDLDDDLPADEKTRRNAAQLDSEKDLQLTSSMEAYVELLLENPENAEDTLSKLQDKDPKLAGKLAKMYASKSHNQLGKLLEDADDSVKQAFDVLSKQLSDINDKGDQQIEAQEKKTYNSWLKSNKEVSKKSEEGKTKFGGKLRTTLADVLEDMFDDTALTEDVLNEALVIAKHRVGWTDKRVKKAVDKFAIAQAAKNRGAGSGSHGSGLKASKAPHADKEIAESFGDDSPERLKKVAKAKKKAGLK